MIHLDFIKDIKMKKTTSNHALQSKLWIVLLVSTMGLSACSNEVEETPDNTVETTVGETTTDMDMANTDSAMDPAVTETTGAVTDSTTSDEMADGSITSDTTMVDEDNTSFNQDPEENTQ